MPKGRRNPPSRLALPSVVDPTDHICFQVMVPNNLGHIAAFTGAIFRLGKAYTWENDNSHTALQVAAVWMKIYDNLKRGCPEPVIGSAGADEETMLRQSPTNPCKLQTSVNGIDWCDWADISLCVAPSGQPGPNPNNQPGPGKCSKFHMGFPAASTGLVPAVVSAGDVLTFSDLSGAGNDPDYGLKWFCVDGSEFFAGVCNGPAVFVGSDPAPAFGHMVLLAKIGSTYYSLASPITVPAGITNAQVIVQANDSVLYNDNGGYQLDVEVCNNQASTWSKHIDFTVTDGGFARWLVSGYGSTTLWISGTGWQAHSEVDPNNATSRETTMLVKKNLTGSFTITSLSITYHTDRDEGPNMAGRGVFYGATEHVIPNGTGSQSYTDPSPVATPAYIGFSIGTADAVAVETGLITLISMDVSGTGTNPF